MNKKTFARRLLAWFDRHGRHDLPWQVERTPYRVWVSEIMLQQTQVATVIPYFQSFMQCFPDVAVLANASDDEVMAQWAGLGYYARARNLHRAAKIINEQGFPDTLNGLQALPGIGRSTAGAILAQAFDRRGVILDGNAKRVLARFAALDGWPGQAGVQKALWMLADELTPSTRPADYTQAIMDLGSMLCTRAGPDCRACPLCSDCRAHALGQPEAFPGRRPVRQRRIRELQVLLCHQQARRVWLVKRPANGIWGGMWSLPQCESSPESANCLHALHSQAIHGVEAGDMIEHDLTHLRLQIRTWRIETDKPPAGQRGKWCTLRDAQALGMPRPIERLVYQFFQASR